MAKIGFKTQVLRRSWHIGDRFLLFRRAVLISFPLWPFSSDGSGPMPGPRPVFFGRPGARLLEKGQSPGRPGARLLGKGRKIQAFWLLYIVKFQGPSRPEARHSWKGSSLVPARARLFNARPRPWPNFSGPDPSLPFRKSYMWLCCQLTSKGKPRMEGRGHYMLANLWDFLDRPLGGY